MTDDPDLLTVAGHAATDLMTHNGIVADWLVRMSATRAIDCYGLTFTAVRDKIADALGCHLANLKRELADAHGRAAANGARVAELAAMLRPFADAYGRLLAGRPQLDRYPDDTPFILPVPTVGAWRAAHRAVYPPKEPTT